MTVGRRGRVGPGHQRRGRRAARGVQRLPAPRLASCPALRASPPARRRRIALPVPLLDLRPRRPAAQVAARRRSTSRATFALHPVGVETWGGLRLRAPDAGPGAAARRPGRARRARRWPTTGWRTWSPAAVLTYDVAANYKVLLENYNECYHCGPVHPELSRLVPAFAGGGGGLDWDEGIPHREGAWTFTTTGTTDRAPLPGLDEDERTRHKGDLVYPNLMLSASADHVAAFVLQPRRGRPDHGHLLAAVRGRRGGQRRRSTRATPPTCGTSSTGRTGRSASRSSGACRRGPTRTAGSRRWRTTASTSGAGCCPGWSARAAPMADTSVDYVVVGLGALGSAAAWQLARRGHRVRGARAVRARPRPRGQPRHQPDPAAQLPHAGLRPS